MNGLEALLKCSTMKLKSSFTPPSPTASICSFYGICQSVKNITVHLRVHASNSEVLLPPLPSLPEAHAQKTKPMHYWVLLPEVITVFPLMLLCQLRLQSSRRRISKKINKSFNWSQYFPLIYYSQPIQAFKCICRKVSILPYIAARTSWLLIGTAWSVFHLLLPNYFFHFLMFIL